MKQQDISDNNTNGIDLKNNSNQYLERLLRKILLTKKHILSIALLIIIVSIFVLGNSYLGHRKTANNSISNPNVHKTEDPENFFVEEVILPEYNVSNLVSFDDKSGISRVANPITVIPSRKTSEVVIYTVQQGDSVFSIAEQFGVEPETILWSNYDLLKDNPRFIKIGQELNLLPVDGVYYRYNAGESLNSIAITFGVEADDIIEYPGNHLDPYEIDPFHPEIADGTWLIIPGGERALQDWGPPAISRANPAVAAYYGSGSCGEIYEGPVGDGVFVWPAVSTIISGYHYDPGIHEAIDIGGVEGSSIFASDTGVVVYAGQSEFGYGNLIVIDHGNGWQTAYAHLQSIFVRCGQAVYRGDTIGSLGSTGNSTGPHLHFEMKSSLYGNVNPLNYIYGGG